jgi:hypothetical protein
MTSEYITAVEHVPALIHLVADGPDPVVDDTVSCPLVPAVSPAAHDDHGARADD